MEEYNPNAVWKSTKKKFNYVPPELPRMPGSTQEKNGEPQPHEPVRAPGKKMVIIAIAALVVLVAAIGIWYAMSRPVPVPVVTLNFAPVSEIAAGEQFTLGLLYMNSSTVVLRNASLTVALPDGVFFAGQPQSERSATVSLGDITAGNSGEQDMKLLATSEAGAVLAVSSTISYATDASHGALYATSNTANLAVGPGAIGLSVSAPANVFSGQDFTTEISYRNTTPSEVDGVQIVMQYPPGFTFTDASPTPAFPVNTTWNIGTLAPGAGGTILITGNMSGKNAALYSISGSANIGVSGISYAVASQAANIAITASPLTVSAVVNNAPNYIAKLADYLDYEITYTNLSSTTFRGITITAALTGAMFDLSSLQSDAAFNSRTGTLTWYTANTPALALLSPGGSGTVDFRVKTKSAFPIASPADKNFSLAAHLSVSSMTVPAGTVATSTSASADISNKVSGVVTVDATGYRYEPGTSIQNSGPYPPKVNQSTSYTIHWDVVNYSTDVTGVMVSAYLQSGTTCTGMVTSNVGAVPVCDPSTGEVTWTIPTMAAATGVLGSPAEAVFQVENMPAVNQAGQTITLLGKTSLTATDGFTGATLSASSNPVGTDIPEDTGVMTNDRSVQE